MKTSLPRYLLGFVAILATSVAGCIVEDNTPYVCQTDKAALNVYNYSDEQVSLSLTGPTNVTETLAIDASVQYTLVAGSYQVSAVGVSSGALLASDTVSMTCDSTHQITLMPANTLPPEEGYAELDLANDTGENLQIYIDGYFENILPPGQVGLYLLEEGYHSVVVIQEDTGEPLYDDSSDPTYYYADTVYELSITSTQPEVEVHNNLDLTYGAGAECVVTWVDYDLGYTDPIVFDSGFSNVCPAEIGYFGVFHGDHIVEIMGEESSFFYIDDYQHFPENTVTVYDVY